MGQIRKINDVYYIEFHARGLLYSQIAGDSLEKAQRLLEDVEKKIAGGEALTIIRHIDLPDFYERFLAEVREQLGPLSVKRFAATITHFNDFLLREYPHVSQLAQLTPAILESYKDHLVKTEKVKIVNFSILFGKRYPGIRYKIGIH